MSLGMWFKGLRGKMLLILFIPALISGSVCVFSLNKVHLLLSHLERQTFRIDLATYDGTIDAQESDFARWMWTGFGSDRSVRATFTTKASNAYSLMKETINKSYEGIPQTPETKAIVDAIRDEIKKVDAEMLQSIALAEKNTPEADVQAKSILTLQVRPVFNEIEDNLSKLNKLRKSTAENGKAEGVALASSTTNVLLFGTLAGIAIGVLFGISVAVRLAKYLGDVSISLKSSGEQVSAASQQLSQASQTLSSSTTENAAAIQETASSLEEFSSMVKQNADNAREANQLSQTAKQIAEAGEGEAKELMTSIDSIVNSSKKIEEIISVIDGIAFQTNLLALNAAVEAARAGEHGKGFAVVAEAVRNLAQRSAGAAKEISTLIKDNVEKSNQGSKVALKSSESLNTIVVNVKKVSDLISEIASASQEQSQGIEQIAKAINQVDQTTQSNAATSEESAAASEELSAQAILLKDMVVNLVTIVEGSAA